MTHLRGMVPNDIVASRLPSDPQVSPDGSVVAFTITTPDLATNRYRRGIWTAEVLGGARAAAFSGGGEAHLPRWSPDGRHLAFVAIGDDGRSSVCILPFGSGGERVVVCAPPGPVSDLAWAPDGSRLAFVGRDVLASQYGPPGQARDHKDMQPRWITSLHYRLNGEGWTVDRPNRLFIVPSDGSVPPRALTLGPYEADGLTWSPDGTWLAFASGRHPNHDLDLAVDLWMVEADGNHQPERLTEGVSAYSFPAWSPDGRSLAYFRDPAPLEAARHRQVGVIDVASHERQDLTGSLDRNCSPFGSTRPPCWVGDQILFSVENSGNLHLYQVSAAGAGQPTLVVGGDRWVSEWHWSAGTLAYIVGSPTDAGELVTKPLELGSSGSLSVKEPERPLTDLSGTLRRQVALVGPERFVAHSQDGTAVECWAMPPAGAVDKTLYPVLLNVHGGPFTQYGNRFMDDFQLQASAGFGVLYCNPRGSSGYSEAWGRAVRWPECKEDPGSGWGGVDFDDVMACVDQACRRFGWADPDRVGILGGSYGGYMTSWAVGHTSRFKAACSERACNNLLTMEHSTDIAGFLRGYVGVSHIERPGAYTSRSPVAYVEDMTSPLLMLHSEEDLRCPINQAEELFVALRLLGRNPTLIRFPGENHALTQSGTPAHRITRAGIILDWFHDKLGGVDSVTTPCSPEE